MVRVPPFRKKGRLLFQHLDLLSKEGAEVLCRGINAAWAEAGHPHIHAVPKMLEVRRGRLFAVWGIDIQGLHNGVPIPRKESEH